MRSLRDYRWTQGCAGDLSADVAHCSHVAGRLHTIDDRSAAPVPRSEKNSRTPAGRRSRHEPTRPLRTSGDRQQPRRKGWIEPFRSRSLTASKDSVSGRSGQRSIRRERPVAIEHPAIGKLLAIHRDRKAATPGVINVRCSTRGLMSCRLSGSSRK
jgi:hypothetical protein